MKWYSYLICVVLIISGIFCGANLIKIWSQKSGVYGSIESIESKNNYTDVAKFDLGIISFESDNNVDYSFSYTDGYIEFDGNSDYSLLINDSLVSDVIFEAGKIIADAKFKFYGSDGKVVSVAELNIYIEFLSDKTVISITTKNNNDSMAYLMRYVNVNGFVIKVVE